MDIKKFNRFLYSYQVSPTNVILCIIENTALVLHVLLEVRAPRFIIFSSPHRAASAPTYRAFASTGLVPHVLHSRSALVSVGGGKTGLWWITRCTA